MEIVPFENLPISTITVMVYSNVSLNQKNIFCKSPIQFIDPPLTKKKKNIDKKRIRSPYGTIVFMQFGIYFRGVRLSKKKKYWCPLCQLVDEKEK